ncbi:uncharacterized protein V1516DRAFT_677364 [Lipomyces oligophaga]|uniref:uncharacterized protein n=1 Tax=Lipomyces oligophaga TaxID=45792 RepID=UPI0034CE0BA8
MPQGSMKITKPKVPSKPSGQKKAAKRIIAPKKGLTATSTKLAKKHSGAIAVNTEKLLSSRVGHLELLKGSRREIAKKDALKAAKERIGKLKSK